MKEGLLAELLAPGLRKTVEYRGCDSCQEFYEDYYDYAGFTECFTGHVVPQVGCREIAGDVFVSVVCHGQTSVATIPRSLFDNDEYAMMKRIVIEAIPS